MKKIIIALIVVVLACSCVTETGLCFDMRVTESTYRIYEPTEEPITEEPVETPPMVGAMVVIRVDEEGSHIESNSSDAITTSASTEADVLTLPSRFPSPTIEGDKGEDAIILKEEPSTAPYLPPTTLEEETYSGRTRFLNRTVGTPSSEGIVPPRENEDGRGSALVIDPNYYVELGDDWDFSIPTEPSSYDIHIYPNKDPNSHDNPFNMDDEFKFNVQPQN